MGDELAPDEREAVDQAVAGDVPDGVKLNELEHALIKEVRRLRSGDKRRHHPIVGFSHYKVGGDRQGIILTARCPETDEQVSLPYSPSYENVAECHCGELITLGTCLPIRWAHLGPHDLDIAERNTEKFTLVADELDVDPSYLATDVDDIDKITTDDEATDAAWAFCHRMEAELQLTGDPTEVFPSEAAREAFDRWRREAKPSIQEVDDRD
jgi:hypothetical protein